MSYTAEEKKELFDIARNAVRAALDGREYQPPPPRSEKLARPSGVFVTLKMRDELRGCIGSVAAVEPLYIGVARNAVNAAFGDPRFPSLTPREFKDVEFEISVMTVPEPVKDFSTVQVGRDGLIVRRGRFAGLLLPQVATEHGWDRETFLSYTCMKAGLPSDSWKRPDCRVEKFTAEVFSETPEAA